jgi:hypothetical protein
MPPKTRTTIPADPDDLYCDTCPERFTSRGGKWRTIEVARVAGWHIYIGPGIGGQHQENYLCPGCVGTSRTRIPAPPVLEGQTDVLAELSITWEPVIKKRGDTT